MAAVSDFLTRVLPYAVGCTDIMAERAILDSAIEFCRRSFAIEEVETYAVPAGGPVPAGTFGTGLQVLHIMDATWDKRPIEPTTVEDLNANFPGWEDYGQSTPSHIYTLLDDPKSVALFQVPSQAGSLVVRFAMIPTRTATTLPDSLANYWPEAIAYGALERIYRLPNQPFSDAKASLAYGQMFQIEISKARLEAIERRARGRSEVKLFAFGSR